VLVLLIYAWEPFGSNLDPELAVLTELFLGFLQYLYANVDTAPEN
jgi:hypothetical protein